ncbi:MAG: hypothetical protein ACQKBV_07030 [Puniceicoccales bacterium]
MSKVSRSRSPYVVVLVASLALHVAALAILGGVTIWDTLQPHAPSMEAPPSAAPPPPRPIKVTISKSSIKPSQARIAVQKVQMVDIESVDITVVNPNSRVSMGGFGPGGGLHFAAQQLPTESFASLFGSTQSDGFELKGEFFDLKQTPDRSPKEVDYAEVVRTFTDGSWSHSQLKRFYRAERTLFASTLLIPHRKADEAPAAFGVAKEVQPSQWLAYYQGTITMPFSGKFRFWGFADDVLIVRAKNRIVLDGSFHEGEYTEWRSDAPDLNRKFPIGNGALAVGDWISARQGQQLEIEILIGERPGGHFSTYLLVEEQGKQYPTSHDGRPVLPIFKMTPLSTEGEQQLTAEIGHESKFISLSGPSFARTN